MAITSLLDTDLYKLTQGQMVFHQAPDNLMVEYKFYNRTEDRDVLDVAPFYDIVTEIRNIMQLKFTEDELLYLKKLGYFKDDYINFLRTVGDKRPDGKPMVPCKIKYDNDGRLSLTFSGPWRYSVLYEVPILAALSQLYSVNIMRHLDIPMKGDERLSSSSQNR